MKRCMFVEMLKPASGTWKEAGQVLRMLDRETTLIANRALQLLWDADQDARKSVQVQDGKVILPTTPKGKLDLPKVALGPNDLYHELAAAFPSVSTSIITAIRSEVWQHYFNKRIAVLRMSERIPFYKTGGSNSFGVRTNNYTLTHRHSRHEDNVYDEFVLSVGLLSRRHETTRFEFVLRTSKLKPDYRQVLLDRAVLCGEKVNGRKRTPPIIMIKQRGMRWCVFFTFEQEPAEYDGLISDRELRVSLDSDECTIKLSCQTTPDVKKAADIRVRRLDTSDIEHNRHSIYKRVRRLSRHYKDASRGGILGHGRQRAIRAKSRLWRKQNNFQLSTCQNRSATIREIAVQWRCARVVWEKPDLRSRSLDKSTQWFYSFPWYQFETCLRHECEEHGLEFTVFDFSEPEKELSAILETAESRG